MKIDEIIADKKLRKALFEKSFLFFYAYFSKNETTEFQRDWIDALPSDESIMIEAFRGSAKTTIVRWYVLWLILYKKEPYIVVQSFEDTLSKGWVREVAKMLVLPEIVSNYGIMFPMNMKREDMAKGSMGSFESTNGVKIEARGLGGTIRGANTFSKDGESVRPTLLILDDIDVEKSVQNETIIDQNERKIIGETMGALDPARRRVIFLGNVINEDGVVPRFKKRYKNEWRIFSQWIYDENGACVWGDVFTDEVIRKLKADGERSFAQNYLGIPFSGGDAIIKRTSIKYINEMPAGAKMVIGIDPAFSEKTGTDGMGFALT
jgi:hypothetical protein